MADLTQDAEKRLMYRMQRIIPRNLNYLASTLSPQTQSDKVLLENPHEIEFQMTWGKVAAKVWGPPDGKPVIACHGWLDNAGTFDNLIPLLPQNLRIISLDIPGHGLSDAYPPDIAYNFHDCILAVERISRLFKWEKISFLTHSIGGCMAVYYAATFPEKVDKLVSIDAIRGPITYPETINKRFRKTAEKLLRFEAMILAGPEKPQSYDFFVKRHVEATAGSLDEKACDVLFKRGLKKVEGGYVLRRDLRLLAAPLHLVGKGESLAQARNITCEMLVIKSKWPFFDNDEDVKEQLEALKTNTKSFRYVEVDALHHVHITHPELIAPLISDFFNS